jgi:DNA-binding NtrC family response regulator
MANVLLVGLDDAALSQELERGGHSVSRLEPAQLTLASQAPAPDVALVRAAGLTPSRLHGLVAESPATAWVWVLPPASAHHAGMALEAGAADVALEPLLPAAAAILVARILRDTRARIRLDRLDEESSRGAQLDEVVGDSPAMRELLDKISRLSRRSAHGPPLSVLLTGETGTGKGLLARVLHYSSRRRDGPFVPVNCAAIPGSLLEAELFGHERGAFTDARTARVGLIEAAHGGTVFLDEISHLSTEGQAKLLTVLETRRVRRLGSTAERPVEVQVLAASSHDLPRLVQQGRMVPELFHRLAALWLQLPPLRARDEDPVLLAERFVSRITARYQLPPKTLGDAARAAIRAHPWPGNVRELYHAIERAVLFEDRDQIEPSDLALHPLPPPASAPPAPSNAIPDDGLAAIERAERELIARALEAEGGNVTRAAARLKTTRDTLRSRMERFGLSRR